MNASPPSLTHDLAAFMDWWRDAGVDLDFADDATAWLHDDAPVDDADPAKGRENRNPDRSTTTAAQIDAAPAREVPRANLIGDNPPETLKAFHTFWLEAPGLDGIGPHGRIAPRGPAGADLMVLVVHPEESDKDALLGGQQGQLLSRMLAAMGIGEEMAYIASALPRHTPMADCEAIAQTGMNEVLALHIKLAAPKRVIALGRNILPLLGHDRAQDVTSLREINHDGASTPLLVSEGLESMMSMPRLKARFWRRWIEWLG